MQRRSEGTARGSSLLTVTADSGSWGFPSVAVLGVETSDEQPADEPPPALLPLLGVAHGADEHDARVLVLQAAGQRRKIEVHGALKLLDSAQVELLPLPPELRAVSPLLSHVALVGGKPTLFVVSPERLLESLGSGQSPGTNSSDLIRG